MGIKDTVANTLLFLKDRRTAYQLFFKQPAGQEVLGDLLKFSKWIEGPGRPTNEETWRLIGRQDVIRRIQQHINLSSEQLFALYNGAQVPSLIGPKEDEND